ncbi:MAG TPA: Imm1 family immunity protein [Candidatus Angelobacter sp.]
MTVEFFDRQDQLNPANGSKINSRDISTLFASFSGRKPFFCELLAENGYKQLVGVGGTIGCVQHSSIDGEPPYLMAVGGAAQTDETEIEFLIGNTVTPVSTHYCMPFQTIKQVAAYFVETGGRDPSVSWEEI